MKVINTQLTVSEIKDMINRKDLIVNKEYQRSPNIWPIDAKSYFIDTILEGYPFPKVYFYQVYDKAIKKPLKEIVDGQQRITTLLEFMNNKLRLSSASEHYKGKVFDDLEDKDQETFLLSAVQVDIIVAAERTDLLEMFRRMNAYTVPLNPAEKRHSEYQGHFKWFINEMSDKYSPILQEFNVLTAKQAIRMTDAEFLSELILILDKGVINKDSKSINDIYKKYDKQFDMKNEYEHKLSEFFCDLTTNLKELRDSFIMKPYVLQSLFCAMMHKKYGIPRGAEVFGVQPIGCFYSDTYKTLANLRSLADAHELQDTFGVYGEYVISCLSTTHRITQRATRARYILDALV